MATERLDRIEEQLAQVATLLVEMATNQAALQQQQLRMAEELAEYRRDARQIQRICLRLARDHGWPEE